MRKRKIALAYNVPNRPEEESKDRLPVHMNIALYRVIYRWLVSSGELTQQSTMFHFMHTIDTP